MKTYKAEISLWPFSTSDGPIKDQLAVGGHRVELTVHADSINDALDHVDLFRKGLLANPRLWQCPTQSIVQVADVPLGGHGNHFFTDREGKPVSR